ncbi:MAG: efflux transporter outer membrane subunit [Pseudomonadota bacterium]
MMRNVRDYVCTTAAIIAVTGCATPGPKQALEPITADLDSWAAVSEDRRAAPVTSNWLGDLQDPQVTDIVEIALEQNYDLNATRERFEASLDRARVTRADMLPQINGSGSGTRSRNAPGGFQFGDASIGAGDVTYNSNYTLAVQLTWEIDVWGRLADQTRAAYLDADARNLDYAAAQLSVAGNAAQSHYGLAAARLQRQLAERNVETNNANLRVINRRYERGISTSLDLRLARASLASSEATLEQRRQQELEAARQLEVLLGQYPAASIEPADALPSLTPILSDGRTMELGTPEELLDRRPDVIAAERRLKAAGLRVSAARKAFLPSISLSTSANESALSSPDDNADFSDLLDFDNVAADLVGNLTQPLFQGGRLRANEQAAKDDAEAALYDYGTTVLTAWREVEDAIAAEQFLSEQEKALERSFEERVAVENITQRRYLSGTVDIFDFINSQQRRIEAEGQLIDAQQARLNNRVSLYLALGAPYLLKGDAALATAEAPMAERASAGDLL